MPVKLRLARHGRKKFAFYHIVAADGRAPRDGKFIERLGIYNPNTNPATIELDFEKSLNWLEKGAQPTETVRAILSYKGVLMKWHLLTGVRKGAFSEEEAERRFTAWLKQKEGKIQAKKDGLVQAKEEDTKKRIESESRISEARAAEILKKKSAIKEDAEHEASSEAEAVGIGVQEQAEATTEESRETEKPAEEPVAEQPFAEAPAEEGKEEEKPAEEPVAELIVKEEPLAEAASVEEENGSEQMDTRAETETPKGKEAGKESVGKKPDQARAAGKNAAQQTAEAPKDSGETGEEKSA